MLGAGGHFKTQKASGLVGSERRKNRYRWWSSLLISTELLLRARLAVLRIAVRSGARTEGFGGICGNAVVDGSREGVPVEGCGRKVVMLVAKAGGDDMATQDAVRDMFAGERGIDDVYRDRYQDEREGECNIAEEQGR